MPSDGSPLLRCAVACHHLVTLGKDDQASISDVLHQLVDAHRNHRRSPLDRVAQTMSFGEIVV